MGKVNLEAVLQQHIDTVNHQHTLGTKSANYDRMHDSMLVIVVLWNRCYHNLNHQFSNDIKREMEEIVKRIQKTYNPKGAIVCQVVSVGLGLGVAFAAFGTAIPASHAPFSQAIMAKLSSGSQAASVVVQSFSSVGEIFKSKEESLRIGHQHVQELTRSEKEKLSQDLQQHLAHIKETQRQKHEKESAQTQQFQETARG